MNAAAGLTTKSMPSSAMTGRPKAKDSKPPANAANVDSYNFDEELEDSLEE